MAKDLVELHIEPLISKEEIIYLRNRSCIFGKRSDLHVFINNMLNFVIALKPARRYVHLEFFILLKINDQQFLTNKQRSRINEYSKNFNYNVNKTGAAKKGSLRLAIDKFQPKALEARHTLKVLNRPLPKLAPKSREEPIAVDEGITLEVILSKRLQLCRSARSRNLEFSLSDEDVRTLLERKTCYYTGARFSKSEDYKKTVDRIDSSKGYIPGNVVACTNGANQLKNSVLENNLNGRFTLTLTQLKKMVGKL